MDRPMRLLRGLAAVLVVAARLFWAAVVVVLVCGGIASLFVFPFLLFLFAGREEG